MKRIMSNYVRLGRYQIRAARPMNLRASDNLLAVRRIVFARELNAAIARKKLADACSVFGFSAHLHPKRD